MLLALLFAGALAQNPAGLDASLACNSVAANASATMMCLGEAEQKAGEALDSGSADRRRHFELAIGHYRKASSVGRQDVRLKALTALAGLYDEKHLNEPGGREIVLRELIALDPSSVAFVFQLADLQQAQGLPDAAEQTLLDARQRLVDTIEVFRKLAQFYARRVTALQDVPRAQVSSEPDNPGQPDPDGVYRIGGQFPPPQRLSETPEFPEEARAAGIQGTVEAEIVVGTDGSVTDAQIVRSIPMLDEAALAAVRRWRFNPKIVDGKPVSVRMVVTISFRQ